MRYLIQHFSTIMGHVQAKIHDRAYKRLQIIAFPSILRYQLTIVVLHIAVNFVINLLK